MPLGKTRPATFFHVAHHPGYYVRDPGAFFLGYGTYALTMLELVRYGDMSTNRKFPPFNSNVMLENSPFAGNLYRFLKLVDDTIQYLQATTSRKPEVWVSAAEARPVFSMIHVPSDAEMPGQLHRVHCPDRVARWVCAARFKDLVDQTVFSNLGLLLKTPQWCHLKYTGVLNLRFTAASKSKCFAKH
ncbi:hypothetical protein BG006_002674 [Podila minutissima]|uniref:Uncharacterized protein n=1 Tax=Podila minutissima TaxID=64525 RepID=A0A9P5VNV4_9FUNG|nr:hypothetical protein BG006_002674 [Podila minutissima]